MNAEDKQVTLEMVGAGLAGVCCSEALVSCTCDRPLLLRSTSCTGKASLNAGQAHLQVP